ncbi:MAG: HAMP domain-containing protein, partial [Alphaproteobacteria bacterium]|nr:HAMP domain-containing protein [Alphaproteobacteria bacterium]
MTQTLRRHFGSIAFKITSSLAAMGIATGAAVIVGLLVFASLGASVQSLMTGGIPRIGSSLTVIAESRAARDALASVTLAAGPEALDQARQRFGMALDELDASVATMDSAAASGLPQMVDDLAGAVDRMAAALGERFRAEAQMIAQIKDFQSLAATTSEALTELSDTAFFDLSIGGETTVTTVRGALETLSEDEFGLMQAIMEARADLNLVTSLALAINAEQDAALAVIMRDIVTAAFNRMDHALTLLKDNNRLADSEDTLLAARDALGQLAKGGFARRPGLSERLLALRKESDAALGQLIDDQSFALAIMAEDRATETDAAIRKLVDTDVGKLRETSQIEIAVKSLFVDALLGAASQDTMAVEAAQASLTEKARVVAANATVDMVTPDLRAGLDRIIAFADSKDGLLATRRTYLDAVTTAAALSRDASDRLTQIAATAQEQGAEAMQAMVRSGDAVLAETARARAKMLLIGGMSAALLLLSPLLTWFWIVKPMGRVTRVTERLATGDLAPVTGFERTGGEIGRMAAALGVFRDGLIDREAIQIIQERGCEALDRANTLASQEAERVAEVEATTAQAERDARERARDDADRARQAGLARRAQAE